MASASTSVSGAAQTHSLRSTLAAPSTIKTVVTSPPWARDEPPSPVECDSDNIETIRHRYSDITSYESSLPEIPGPSRWWAFARHRPTSSSLHPLTVIPTKRGLRDWDRSLSIPWLNGSHHRRSQDESLSSAQGKESGAHTSRRASVPDRLYLDIPPTTTPITIAQNPTPGWETPWTARPPDLVARGQQPEVMFAELPEDGALEDEDEKLGVWARRKKRCRSYMMYNPYVPLLFRFINVILTTAALAIAIRIRITERRNSIMGAVGSSPTLVIIFASLTLVHVVVAIYLEYFGRPLGLWRTSAKLAYTLIEVVFICAWSAALALSFDNFFTSLIPCASPSSISWYDKLPRPTIPGLTPLEGTAGDLICDDQLALICLVGVGLIMYCSNLVISLFRIFERVKYRPSSLLP
ncbi:hypothetical protein AcV5_004696 [Taiwanofungus camphoratus]|nr:hypothetical protein AcV5_004696 [Antrodia cinnamomea]